jgi:hypothetical protein
MKTNINDKLIAYLALLSGLSISAVAIYYSVMGLIAIYPASVIPIIVMGVVIELGKLSATLWLKQNWEHAPRFLKAYILPAVIVLMLITSVGVFGFLSKAHSDQSLVSGDVAARIAIYDEKIKTAKENIESNRKQLKQMDEAVDQVMARSLDEKGAEKANAIRKNQSRDRVALAKDIEANQKLVVQLNDEAAPIRAEVRKVEAEVGPIKYIAAFIYGSNPDSNLLEKAVTWVTILIVIVLDPMAVILLLASQYSFQRFRKEEEVETTVVNWEIPPPTEPILKNSDEDTANEILKQGVTNSNPADNVPLTTDFEGVREPGGEWIQTGPSFEVPVAPPVNQLDIATEEEIEEWNRLLAAAEKAVMPTPEPESAITHTEEGVVVKDSAGTVVISTVPHARAVSDEYIQIGDNKFHHRAYDPKSKDAYDAIERHNAIYIQNEEQTEADTKWKEITNSEYQETARKNQETIN